MLRAEREKPKVRSIGTIGILIKITKKNLNGHIRYYIMKKNCLECGEPFSGRIDKKFCSDYCRNSFNNKINKESKNLIRNINNRLRKNHRLLSDLNQSGKTKVTRRKLLDGNFDFNYFTSIYTTKTGNTYYYIYDQGYLALENDYYLLIKRD